jgi:hypothetical protein
VQGLENLAALDEGSVLCTEGRQLLGRVDDVLGPVTQPVYAVRYCGAGSLPTGLAPMDRVFSITGRSQLFDRNAAEACGPARDWDAAVDGELDSNDEGQEDGVAPDPQVAAGCHVGKKRGGGARLLAQGVGRGARPETQRKRRVSRQSEAAHAAPLAHPVTHSTPLPHCGCVAFLPGCFTFLPGSVMLGFASAVHPQEAQRH